MHWAAKYIGQPWVMGVSDCWHFARQVWREEFGLDVPAVITQPAGPLSARRALRGDCAGWVKVPTPAEGDGVMMAKGQMPCHVGIWVSPGSILHAVEGIGVICTPKARIVGMGYHITGFYRMAAE